jgi:hypothetical protein
MFKIIVTAWIVGLVIAIGLVANGEGLTALVVALLGVAIGAVCVQLYFLPAINARKRCHPNTAAIFVINLFLGWTLLGWVGALAWSCTEVSGRPAVS